MTRSITFLIPFVLISFLTFSQKDVSAIQSTLQRINEENPDVTMSIGLIQKGEKQYFNFGNTSRDQNAEKVNKQSVFEIASITKAVTGNLLAQAVNEGKVNLNEFIEAYLPSQYILGEGIRNKVKVSDLASHQSGLVDIDFPALIEQNSQQPTAIVDLKMLANLVNSSDSLLDYGSYRYSTLGFVLIGQILEQVYKENYETLVKREIQSVLKLSNTYTNNFKPEMIVKGYNPEGGLQEPFVWNCVAPAGLIKASAEDMVTYLEAILNEGNIRSKAALLQEQTYFESERITIGLGVNMMVIGENKIFAKTGDTMGQSSIMAYDRANNWGLIIFINERNAKLRNMIFNEFVEILNGESIK